MPKKYDACNRLEIEGRDKPLWPKVGITVTIRDDGKVSIWDARTGQSYPCFEREQREQQQAPAPQAAPLAEDPMSDDIPFTRLRNEYCF